MNPSLSSADSARARARGGAERGGAERRGAESFSASRALALAESAELKKGFIGQIRERGQDMAALSLCLLHPEKGERGYAWNQV